MTAVIAIILGIIVFSFYAIFKIVQILITGGAVAGKHIVSKSYKKLKNDVLTEIGYENQDVFKPYDEIVTVKSRQALNDYNYLKFFKSNKDMLEEVENKITEKCVIASVFENFLSTNNYQSRFHYQKLKKQIEIYINNANSYIVYIQYITPAGNLKGGNTIRISQNNIDELKADPSLYIGKSEYNRQLKEKLNKKQHEYYNNISQLINYINDNIDSVIIKGNRKQLEEEINKLIDERNRIVKIKSFASIEWDEINDTIAPIIDETEKIININIKVLEYYNSPEFLIIKDACAVLMNSQKEFNEYINDKAQSISQFFGTRIMRNETVFNDEYNYVRYYEKELAPFTAEVSSTVYSSAENRTLDYIIKYFYPNRNLYPEQIKKLQMLIIELETLKEAKLILETHKAEYKQYIANVPDFVMQNDETGFYTRLGFADVDESVLTIEYKFSHTSEGRKAKRSFTFPMNEEHIVLLIEALENKLTQSEFAKEQRTLMTKKMREFIKKRDNYTCRNCGNSTYKEPNLLLEIDHIKPISLGGLTIEDNLQTLCWKCNRIKGAKIK